MQATYDSKSMQYDELNPIPVLPDQFKSGQWSDSDTAWVNQSTSDDWKGTNINWITISGLKII